jgi:hypothetical protein
MNLGILESEEEFQLSGFDNNPKNKGKNKH